MQKKFLFLTKKLILITTLILPFTLFAQLMQIGADIDGEAEGDNAGYSVSLSGDGFRIIVGAHNNDGNGSNTGHARIFEYNGFDWVQLGADINGEASNDLCGYSVAISSNGTRVAIGAVFNDGSGTNAGQVRVYEFNGTQWVQLGNDIDGEAAGDESGRSVSLSTDGTRVAIGAIHNNGGGGSAGHVRVYTYNGNSWIKLGGDIDGEASGDNAGFSVSLSADGSKVAVGAYLNDGSGTDAGQVRVFQYSGSAWIQLGGDLNGEAAGDQCGTAVSLSSDGGFVALGANHNDGQGNNSGHARIYQYVGNSWVRLGADLDGEAAGDEFGYSISLSSDGTVVAVGGRRNNGAGNNSGHVRIYKYISGAWVKIDADIDGEAANDESGDSVSLSSDGSTVAIGAQANGGNGAEAGQARIYRNDNVLPVELLSFRGYSSNLGNTLQWQTESEVECRSFDIERSATGLLFKKIGEIPAAGSHSDYLFEDHDPSNYVSYYRLKINDFNGNISYSNLLSILSDNSHAVLIYPTVFNNTLTIQGVKSFKIFSLTRQQVVLSSDDVNAQMLNVETLTNGVYVINGTDSAGHFFIKKIIKCNLP